MKQLTCNKKRIGCVSSGIILLIILWNALMYAQVSLLRYIATTTYIDIHVEHDKRLYALFDFVYCIPYFLFPLFGLFADIKTGRYISIIAGVQFSFVSWLIVGLTLFIKIYFTLELPILILLGLFFILQVIGYCSFRSNIIQFNIDQAIGASADELSTIIYWNSVCIPIVYVLIEIGQCLIKEFIIVCYVVSGVALSTVLITNYLFKHQLDTTPQITNPIKLIAKVFNYARKNKYPRNRSALTYWENEVPSRLELGKEKYGGPFSEEQVEDVKTIMRLTPLLISVVGLFCAEETRWNSFSSLDKGMQFISCFILNNSLEFIVVLVILLLHQLIIHSCFNKWIPRMLRRIGLGLVFAFSIPLYYVLMLACKDHFQLNTNSYPAIIVPQILVGMSFALIFPTSLEFTIAQSPHDMRGFMIGLWYAGFGIGYVININGKYPFKCEGDVICQNIYYFVFKSMIIFVILIVYLVLAKRYKLRVRENEVNVHLIAEEHYDRYIEQEVEYRREMGLSLESSD